MAETPFPILAKVFNVENVVITSDVAAYVIVGGVATAGTGTLAHLGDGVWSYTPAVGEMTDDFVVKFAHASAVGGGPIVQFHSTGPAVAAAIADLAKTSDLADLAKTSDLSGLATVDDLAPLATSAELADLPSDAELAATVAPLATSAELTGLAASIAAMETKINAMAATPPLYGGGSTPLATNAFTSVAEIQRIWSVEGAAVRASDDEYGTETPEPEEGVWQDVIAEASDTIVLYVQNHYDSATLTTNAWVRRQAAWIGAYLLSMRRGNPSVFTARYQEIIANLERIRTGQLQVPGAVVRSNEAPALSNLIIDDRFRISKIRVVPQTSTGGTSGKQHLDPTYTQEYPS